MWWKCENCGKENRNDRSICWNCSTPKIASPVKDVSTVQKNETVSVEEIPTVCAKCSAALDIDSKFCPNCAETVLLHSKINCPNCDKTVDASAKYCKYCATELTKKKEFNFYAPEKPRSEGSSLNRQREQAEKMALAGGGLAIISAIAFFWGINYSSSWSNRARAGFSSFMGQSDSTYRLAQRCVILGIVGFIVGLTLFIVGMSQRTSAK